MEDRFLELEGCSERGKRQEVNRENKKRKFGSETMVVLEPRPGCAWLSGQGLAREPLH